MAENNPYKSVDASPAKSFFVSMLTRDIELKDAILDLLDNCVDGILRSKKSLPLKKPYAKFRADIKFDGVCFEISDNCGGIPWSSHEYAFRMGKIPGSQISVKGSVGAYGIGMKRAIFKLGKSCLIQTQNKKDVYEVDIKPSWIDKEGLWSIPAEPGDTKMKEDGTTIVVGNLYPDIKNTFTKDKKDFESQLKTAIATHYAFILDKGFEVSVNGELVMPVPTKLIFDNKKGGIQPFIYKSTIDGVDVFLAVGFTRPIMSAEELESSPDRNTSKQAGWTVVCNDRTVLYRDKTELTGWGEASVPSYHTQFIGISGIVEFSAEDATKLPTTTTKRGIDSNSTLYLKVKNKMREGMVLFTSYTNKYKGEHIEDAKKQMKSAGEPLELKQIKKKAESMALAPVRKKDLGGSQYVPKLPRPKNLPVRSRRISFTKPYSEIELVSEYLFESPDESPNSVGEECFDIFLAEAKK